MAMSCLFAAFAELVATYGEDAAARYAEGLGARIRNGEFSLSMPTGIAFTPPFGEKVPLDVALVDEDGHDRHLSDYVHGRFG